MKVSNDSTKDAINPNAASGASKSQEISKSNVVEATDNKPPVTDKNHELKEMLVNNKKASGQADKDDIMIVEQMINQQEQDGENDDDDDDEKELEGELEKQGKMVELLLEKFLINTDSPFLDEINIVIVLKCIPTKIVGFSSSLINLSILQNSLIAHKNKDAVDAFDYVDDKNKKRVLKIKNLIEA